MHVWWVAVVLMAGCVGPGTTNGSDDDGNGAAPDAPAEPSESPITLDGCTDLEVIMVGSAEAARPFVPEDFSVPDHPLIIVGAFLCGEDNRVAERGLVAIQVTPNDPALESDGATNYFWEPEHYLGGDSSLGELLLAAHAHATTASTEIVVGGTNTGMTIANDNVTYSWGSILGPAPAGTDLVTQALPPFREYMAADGGYAYLDASFAGDMGEAGFSPGTLTITGDTVGATLFGAVSNQFAGLFVGLEYAGALVGYIPWE